MNAWGKTRSPEFMAKIPAHLTPAIEHQDHPRGAMWESCAIMMYLANTHRLESLYSSDPGRRALIDSDGASPSIADIRLAATLEFMAANDTPLPAWCHDYVSRVESKLGKAYSEPAADVRGLVAQVKKSS